MKEVGYYLETMDDVFLGRCRGGHWRRDGTCSYCGGIKPSEGFRLIKEEGANLTPTDKSYKIYIQGTKKLYTNHFSEEQAVELVRIIEQREAKLEHPGYFYCTLNFSHYLEATTKSRENFSKPEPIMQEEPQPVVLHQNLKSLGESAQNNYNFDHPDPSVLEWFPSPFSVDELNPNKVYGSLHIETSEFTSRCPKTNAPDFATIVLDYIPNERCVESKSLKIYYMGYRNFGEFHESCVNRIANDLVTLLRPKWLKVEGRFTARGGIPFWPTAEYSNPKVF